MSIATSSIGELALGAQPAAATSTSKTPPKRRVTTKADVINQPEAR